MSATGDIMTGTAGAVDSNGATVTMDPRTEARAGRARARRWRPAEVTTTLASLADLRDRGAITVEEYEAKKADLLGRL